MEHSGIHGAIDGVPHLTQWQVEEGYTNNKTVSTSTQHGTNRHKGVYDWTGQYSALGGLPTYMPGDFFDFVGFKSPDAAGGLLLGDKLEGNVLVGSVAITWDWKTNAPLSHVVQFGGNGALAFTTGPEIIDAEIPLEETPCLGKIVTYVDPTETRILHVTQAVLTFTREMKTTINSGTSDGTGKCQTGRRVGAAIDWTLAITTEDGNENAVIKSGNIVNLRAYTTATLFYDLKWGMMGKRSGLTVNRMTGDIISQTHNAEMKGYNVTEGEIKLPGGTTWWPAA